MDPNDALELIREALDRLRDPEESDWNDAAITLAELVEALDEWLSKGGFMPAPWQESRPGHWQEVLVSTNAKAYEAGLKAGSLD